MGVLCLIALLVLAGLGNGIRPLSNDEWAHAAVSMSDQPSREITRYGVITPGINYIKVKVKDVDAGRTFNLVIDNIDFARFLATERGLRIDSLGRFDNPEAFLRFRHTEYIEYMVRSEGKIHVLSLDRLGRTLGRVHHGRENSGKAILESHTFVDPLRFDELGVSSEQELIQRFFEYDAKEQRGRLRKEHEERMELSHNPSFIALLIDLGYVVGRADVVPFLFIRKLK